MPEMPGADDQHVEVLDGLPVRGQATGILARWLVSQDPAAQPVPISHIPGLTESVRRALSRGAVAVEAEAVVDRLAPSMGAAVAVPCPRPAEEEAVVAQRRPRP